MSEKRCWRVSIRRRRIDLESWLIRIERRSRRQVHHLHEDRYVEEGYASSHKGDQDIVVGFEEGVAGYDHSFDGVVEPSVDDGVGISVEVDGEVVVQEFKVVGASHKSQAGYRDP